MSVENTSACNDSAIQNIVLDMGNVLLRFDPWVSLQRYCSCEESRALILRELFQGPEWVMSDRGLLKNAELFDAVSNRIPVSYHAELKSCVEHWDICMEPIDGAAAFCEAARKAGFSLYVLSNANDLFHRYFRNFKEESWFDGVVVSGDEHMIKPDPAIYQLLLDRYQLHPAESLFIDDRPENVEGARSVGMQGFLFEGRYTPLMQLLHLS